MNQMYKTLFLFIVLFQELAVFAAHQRSDSLLFVLDKTIQEKSIYAEKRERRIDSLQTLLNVEADLERRHEIYQRLYEQYRQYNMNSALSVAEKKLMIAEELQNGQFIKDRKSVV